VVDVLVVRPLLRRGTILGGSGVSALTRRGPEVDLNSGNEARGGGGKVRLTGAASSVVVSVSSVVIIDVVNLTVVGSDSFEEIVDLKVGIVGLGVTEALETVGGDAKRLVTGKGLKLFCGVCLKIGAFVGESVV